MLSFDFVFLVQQQQQKKWAPQVCILTGSFKIHLKAAAVYIAESTYGVLKVIVIAL